MTVSQNVRPQLWDPMRQLDSELSRFDDPSQIDTLVHADCDPSFDRVLHKVAQPNSVVLRRPIGELHESTKARQRSAEAFQMLSKLASITQVLVCGQRGGNDLQLQQEAAKGDTYDSLNRAAALWNGHCQEAQDRLINDLRTLTTAAEFQSLLVARRVCVSALLYAREAGVFLEWEAATGQFHPL